MATQPDSAESRTVLAFPQRNKGRIRNSHSIFSMGRCIMSRLEADGETIPANVARFDQPKPPSPVTRSPVMLLAICLYFEASPKARESIRRSLSLLAYDGDEDATALLAFLKREA